MQETGAPEEIRTPDPQICSFVLRAIEERRYAESLTRARQREKGFDCRCSRSASHALRSSICQWFRRAAELYGPREVTVSYPPRDPHPAHIAVSRVDLRRR